MLVDSHCHLDYEGLAEEVEAVVARAAAAGVGMMVTISTTLAGFGGVLAIAERFPAVACTVGVHPHEAGVEGLGQGDGAHGGAERLIALARHAKVVGIGETGLDYYYERSPREAQRASFRAHIRAAQATGLPLVVHTRDAEEDTIALLREGMEEGAFTGLIHCFTGSDALAEAALAMGLLISFSGILTFKKAETLRAVATAVPVDRLLVETDAPFLAPAPHRGRTNEPGFVVHTAACLAGIKGLTPDALAAATTENFFRLFTRAARPGAPSSE